MAEENPITPVDAAEPPKANPLGKAVAPSTGSTLKLNPVVRKPGTGMALKPGLKLPPKPGATVSALRPGLKLPPKPGAATQSALKSGLKLPPRPGTATQSALRPGLNLPSRPQIRKPGATVAAQPLPKPVAAAEPAAVEALTAEAVKPLETPVPAPAVKVDQENTADVSLNNAIKPGLKLPPRPQIRKPGATVAAQPLPKPVTPVEDSKAEVAKAVEAPAPVAKVDQMGVAKLPTVEMQAVKRDEPISVPEPPKPMEALKSVTQKLKGITQAIPQQAILHKTGIIADVATSDAQKEAAKHKTARISLADAIGVAPVKNENAPMKTIRIKRPVGIPGAIKPAEPQADGIKPVSDQAQASEEVKPVDTQAETAVKEPAPSVTQRKTLKISRPGGAVRPAGKFGIKRPGGVSAPTAAKPKTEVAGEAPAGTPDGEVADIPEIADIPSMPASFAPVAAPASSSDGPAWLCTLSSVVQIAACVAIGALAWYLYQDTLISTF